MGKVDAKEALRRGAAVGECPFQTAAAGGRPQGPPLRETPIADGVPQRRGEGTPPYECADARQQMQGSGGSRRDAAEKGLLSRLLTEHETVFGWLPSAPLVAALEGALAAGFTTSDFWGCFDRVAAEWRRGAVKGDVDSAIIKAMRARYRSAYKRKKPPSD